MKPSDDPILQRATLIGGSAMARREAILRSASELSAAYFGISLDQLTATGRVQRVSDARQTAFFIARSIYGYTLKEIGDHFHRDHGTVLHGIQAVQNRIDTDPKFAADLLELQTLCRQHVDRHAA